MNSLDDIFEIPEKKDLNKVNNEDINIDAETESQVINDKASYEKKPRKKHNIPPEKLEIMRANLKKGRDAIKAKKEARLKSEIKEQVIKEMAVAVSDKPKVEIKKEIIIEKPKAVISEKPKVAVTVEQPKPQVVIKPYIVKSTFKKPIW